MPTQRLLSNSEIADFLLRHPIEAARVAETKTAIATGIYDWANFVLNQLPGRPLLIPPWGTQVADSSYGNVIVFFGQGDGQLRIVGWTEYQPDINKAPYVPPPHTCNDGSSPTFGICPEDFNFLYVIGFGLAAYVGYQLFFAKKHA